MKHEYVIDTAEQGFGREEEDYLKVLLMEDEIFINNGWWHEKEGTPWPKDAITIHLICNDVFMWGCADSEDVKHGDLKTIYEAWAKDSRFGTAAWCIKRRKCRPQKPVEDLMVKAGYNIDELIAEEPPCSLTEKNTPSGGSSSKEKTSGLVASFMTWMKRMRR